MYELKTVVLHGERLGVPLLRLALAGAAELGPSAFGLRGYGVTGRSHLWQMSRTG